MKKLTLFLFVISVTYSVYGQQETQSSQFMINPFLFNPAYSSMDNDIDFKLSTRNQWVGIEGAPVTNYFSIDSPVGKPRWAATHPGDFHNWHGLGAQILKDEIGPFSNLKVNLSYSYNLKLIQGSRYGYQHKDGLRLALGIQAGFNNLSVDGEKLMSSKTNNGDLIDNADVEFDEAFNELNFSASQYSFDLNFGGLIYYNQKYYLGISTTQILQSQMLTNSQFVRHYFIMGQVKNKISETSYIIPSFILKYTRHAPISYEVNARYDYLDKYFFGLGYRRGDSFSFMLGAELKWGEKIKHFRRDKHRYKIQLYYAYDYTVSRLNTKYLNGRSGGSHEVTLAFMIPPFFHERNAEDTW